MSKISLGFKWACVIASLMGLSVGLANPSSKTSVSESPPILLRDSPSVGLSTLMDLMGESASMADALTMVERIDKNPEKFPAVWMYPVSHILLDQGKVRRASFLFYLGQLRLRAELQGCALHNPDLAKQWEPLRQFLNESFGPRINEMAFKNLNQLEQTVHEVIAFDQSSSHDLPPGCQLEKGPWKEWRALNRNQYLHEFLIHLPLIKQASKP